MTHSQTIIRALALSMSMRGQDPRNTVRISYFMYKMQLRALQRSMKKMDSKYPIENENTQRMLDQMEEIWKDYCAEEEKSQEQT